MRWSCWPPRRGVLGAAGPEQQRNERQADHRGGDRRSTGSGHGEIMAAERMRSGAVRSRGPTARGTTPSPGRRHGANAPGRGRSRARRSAAGVHVAPTSSQSPQAPIASPARKAAPSVVASTTGETSTGRPRRVRECLDERRVAAHAAVDAQRRHGEAGIGLGGLDEIGAAVRDPLEHRADDLRAPGPAGEAEQRAPRAVVPLGGAETEQRRDVHDPVGVGCTATRRRATPPSWSGCRGRRGATRRSCRPTA